MKTAEFMKAISPAVTKYGESKYPKEILQRLFKNFENVESYIFQEAIAVCCANQSYPPVVKDIEDAISIIRAEKNINRKSNDEINFERQVKTEVDMFQKNYDHLVSKVGQEAVDKYFLGWCKQTMGEDFAETLKGMDLSKNLFMRLAIRDLAESNGKPLEAYNLARRKIGKGVRAA